MLDPTALQAGDEVEMRKPHACGANRWRVTRTGVDIRLQCLQCGRYLLMPRPQFGHALRRVVRKAAEGEPPT